MLAAGLVEATLFAAGAGRVSAASSSPESPVLVSADSDDADPTADGGATGAPGDRSSAEDSALAEARDALAATAVLEPAVLRAAAPAPDASEDEGAFGIRAEPTDGFEGGLIDGALLPEAVVAPGPPSSTAPEPLAEAGFDSDIAAEEEPDVGGAGRG